MSHWTEPDRHCLSANAPKLLDQSEDRKWKEFGETWLIHCGRNKMTAILLTIFSNAFSWMKTYEFQLKFHWNMFLNGLIDNKSALVQIMASHRTGNKRIIWSNNDPVHWPGLNELIHWDRVTDIYICVRKLTIIGQDNGLSPGRRQAIIWTNAGMFLIGPLEQTSVKS